MTFVYESVGLPPLTPASSGLLEKLNDDNVPIGELATLLQMDPVLASKLLKVANSPYFGMAGRIRGLDEALVVIGTSVSRSYVLSDLVLGYFNQDPWKGLNLNLGQFWERSLLTAAFCQTLAPRVDIPDSVGFTVGLFQRIGSLILVGLLGKPYMPVFKANYDCHELCAVEMDLFQTNHGEMGGSLLKSWNIPLDITTAITNQYKPEEERAGDVLAEVVRCGCFYADASFNGYVIQVDLFEEKLQDLFDLDEKTVKTVNDKAIKRLNDFKKIIDSV